MEELQPRQKLKARWRPPEEGHIKINCDGAFCKNSRKGAMGVVCRNSRGKLLCAWAEKKSVGSPIEAEAKALREAIVIAGRWLEEPAIIEMDCKELYDVVTSGKAEKCDWRIQSILADMFQLMLNRSLLSFNLVPREGNEAADCLAAMASRELGPNGLILESPPPLAPIIIREARVETISVGLIQLRENREGIG